MVTYRGVRQGRGSKEAVSITTTAAQRRGLGALHHPHCRTGTHSLSGAQHYIPSYPGHPCPSAAGASQAMPTPPNANVQRWVAQLGYKDLITFTSTDQAGGTVYHTNVMMAIGTGAHPVGWQGCVRVRWSCAQPL